MLANTDPALRRGVARRWPRSDEVGRDPVQVRLLGERLGAGAPARRRTAATHARRVRRPVPAPARAAVGGLGRRLDACAAATTAGASTPTGACTEIPSLGEQRAHPAARAWRPTPAGLAEAAGMVFLAPERAGRPSCSTFPRPTTPRSCTACSSRSGRASAPGLMIDNFLDMAHFPFVHARDDRHAEAATCSRLDDRARRLRDDRARARTRSPTARTPVSPQGIRPLLQNRAARATEYRAPFLDQPAHRLRGGRAAPTCSTSSCSPRTTSTAASTRSVHRNDLDGDADRLAEAVAFETQDPRRGPRPAGALRRPAAAARPHRRGARAADRLTIELPPHPRRPRRARLRPDEEVAPMHDDPVDPVVRARAIAAAQGDEPFDLLLTGGTLVDVGCGELRAADVGIVGPLVASVHEPGTPHRRARRARLHRPLRRARASSTCTCTSSRRCSRPAGTPRRCARAAPPPCSSIRTSSPTSSGVAGRALRGRGEPRPAGALHRAGAVVRAAATRPRALGRRPLRARRRPRCSRWDEVGGLAEVMDMLGVLGGADRMVDVVAAGLESGKLVSGHAAGLTGPSLQALPRGRASPPTTRSSPSPTASRSCARA